MKIIFPNVSSSTAVDILSEKSFFFEVIFLMSAVWRLFVSIYFIIYKVELNAAALWLVLCFVGRRG